MSEYVEIFVPVPQECMGIIIGAAGKNINQLQHETNTRITKSNGDKLVRGSGFTVTGTVIACEEARQAMRRRLVSSILCTCQLPVFKQIT
jgi:ribosomal protein S3